MPDRISLNPPPLELTRKTNKYTMCCSPPAERQKHWLKLWTQPPNQTNGMTTPPGHPCSYTCSPSCSLSDYKSRHSCSHPFSTLKQSHVHTPSQPDHLTRWIRLVNQSLHHSHLKQDTQVSNLNSPPPPGHLASQLVLDKCSYWGHPAKQTTLTWRSLNQVTRPY